MANPFESRGRGLSLNERSASASEPERDQRADSESGGIKLPPPKPPRKVYSVYLDKELMERARRIAEGRGVSVAAVIEACLRECLDSLE